MFARLKANSRSARRDRALADIALRRCLSNSSSPRRLPARLMALLVLLAAWNIHSVCAEEVHVACDKIVGVIRPLHGVNGGPLNAGETVDVSAYWRELAIPITRLHDCEWPDANLVEIHAVFPSLRADPTSPESYQFARTDDYLKAIDGTGAKVVYRLGESIEHTRRKYHVAPAADYDAWTAACLGIIRHENEGWAGGAHRQIRYWEIWDEPDNRPAMWTGSDDDYFRLYTTVAKGIKAQFPALLVGGPAAGGTGDVVNGELHPTAFLAGFLNACRVKSAPLDFFSWHTYSDDPHIYTVKARAIRRWLDEQGFRKTEIHLNEWNYLPGNDWGPLLVAGQGAPREKWYAEMGSARGAAFVASVLIDLQDSPVDIANFYTGDSSPFGLFSRHGVPKKTFYAMKAFRKLLDTQRRIATTPREPPCAPAPARIKPTSRFSSAIIGTKTTCWIWLSTSFLGNRGPTGRRFFSTSSTIWSVSSRPASTNPRCGSASISPPQACCWSSFIGPTAPRISRVPSKCLSENCWGLAHFATAGEQNVPVPPCLVRFSDRI
jgi:hypothetical protein